MLKYAQNNKNYFVFQAPLPSCLTEVDCEFKPLIISGYQRYALQGG